MAYDPYENENSSFLGYLGRAPLEPVNEAAWRAGAGILYNNRDRALDYARHLKAESPTVQKLVRGSKWFSERASAAAGPLGQWAGDTAAAARTTAKNAALHAWYRNPHVTADAVRDAYGSTVRMYGAHAPTIDSVRRGLMNPRFNVAPGDPKALANAKKVLGKTGEWASKAWQGSKTAALKTYDYTMKRPALATGRTAVRFNRAVGEAVQAVPDVFGGKGHKLAKQIFSKKGAAVGLAIQGITDATVSGARLLGTASNRDDLDAAYMNWGKTLFNDFLLRRSWRGLLRGVDSLFLGLPSMLPGGTWLTGGNDFLEHDVQMSETEENYLKALEGSTTMAGAAELIHTYEKKMFENLRKGLDVDGKKLYTTNAKGEAVEMTAEEGTRQASTILAARNQAAAERGLMLYNTPKASMDAASVKDALSKIDNQYNEKAADLETKYADYANWAPTQRAIRRGTTADDWFVSAANNLERQWSHRRSVITKTAAYKDLLENNRQAALDTYLRHTGESIASDEATRRFNYFWNNQDSAFREQFDRTAFGAELIGIARAANEEGE